MIIKPSNAGEHKRICCDGPNDVHTEQMVQMAIRSRSAYCLHLIVSEPNSRSLAFTAVSSSFDSSSVQSVSSNSTNSVEQNKILM